MDYINACKLPQRIKNEIDILSLSYKDFYKRLNEVRLRVNGISTVTVLGQNIRLNSRVSESEIENCLKGLCHGSLYAYEDRLKDGFITLENGMRVGVSGRAKYTKGDIIGIDNVDTLVFRFPHIGFVDIGMCRTLAAHTLGLLVFSPPMGGKTSFLMSLAFEIGKTRRLVIVDERGEFVSKNYKNSMVDILFGYKKADGIDIAVRTHSAEVVMVDELSFGEIDRVSACSDMGIPLIASVHAGSLCEAKNKKGISDMIKKGIFQTFVGIKRQNGAYIYDIYEDKQ